MYNEIVAVVVSPFQGQNAVDKNGKNAVWLTPIAGKIPNRAMVVAGTVAERASLVSGTTVMVMINEGVADEQYGRRFNHTVLGPVEVSDILHLRKELGTPTIVDVTGGTDTTNTLLNQENGGNGAAAAIVPTLATSNLPGADAATED